MSKLKGAVVELGVLMPTSGDNYTIVTQVDGVIRAARLAKKRKPKRKKYGLSDTSEE